MRARFLLIAFVLLLVVPVWALDPLPLPEIVVTRTQKPPVIDGVISPGEWNMAPAATGFHGGGATPGLAHNQTVFQLTYDDT